MILFTDCPEKLDGWFAADTTWTEVVASSLSVEFLNLLELLGEDEYFFSEQADACKQFGSWDCLVVIRNSSASQFDLLTKASREGLPLPDYVACLALAGEKFHGNRSRSWHALEGNIHLSTFHRTGADVNKLGSGLSMVPSVAVMDAIQRVCPRLESVGIKWVNDVLIEKSKVAGVISSTQMQGGQIQSVCWGIGMNVFTVPDFEPDQFLLKPGCLAEFVNAGQIDFCFVVKALMNSLWTRFSFLIESGQENVFSSYRKHLRGIGETVSIWPEDTTDFNSSKPLAQGVLLNINPDLSLILEGRRDPLHRGRLIF